MGQIGIVVDIPDYGVNSLASADFLSIGNDVARQVRAQHPAGKNTTLAAVYVSGPDIIVNPVVQTSVVAGDVAGPIDVDDIATRNTLISVTGIAIADQTVQDFTSEFGSTATGISNTGGSDTSEYTLVVVWF